MGATNILSPVRRSIVHSIGREGHSRVAVTLSYGSWVSVILAMLGASWGLAVATGGASHIAPHWFYIPIFIAGLRFRFAGAAVAGLIAMVVAGPLLVGDTATGAAQDPQDWVSRGIFFLLIGQFVTLLFWQARRSAERELCLSQDVAERREIFDATIRSSEEERVRLAAELHDGPIQRLTGVGFLVERLRIRVGRSGEAATVDLADRVAAEISDEISRLRKTMGSLRPPALDEHGLDAALRDHGEIAGRDGGFECTVNVELQGRLDPAMETALFRVAQEALTNVQKHAKAERVTVSLQRDDDWIILKVDDNGVGFVPAGRRSDDPGLHLGLVAMRERIEMVGGRWELTAEPGSGTHLRAAVPYAERRLPVSTSPGSPS